MLKDGKISTKDYKDIFIKCIPLETNNDIIQSQFSYFMSVWKRLTPFKYRQEMAKKLFNFTKDYLFKLLE